MKLATYNIHKGKNIENKYTLDSMIEYFNKSDMDILCLQEVLKSQHNKILEESSFNGCYQSNVNLKNDEYGIGIYYKDNINFHYIEGNLLTSKNEQRGFINAQIYVNNKLLNIINTHLGLDKEERTIQIKEILKYCEELRGKIFICGDFNDMDIQLQNYYDTATIFSCEDTETFAPTKSRIDYIFISSNIRVFDYYVDKISLSDHYPVNVIFST